MGGRRRRRIGRTEMVQAAGWQTGAWAGRPNLAPPDTWLCPHPGAGRGHEELAECRFLSQQEKSPVTHFQGKQHAVTPQGTSVPGTVAPDGCPVRMLWTGPTVPPGSGVLPANPDAPAGPPSGPGLWPSWFLAPLSVWSPPNKPPSPTNALPASLGHSPSFSLSPASHWTSLMPSPIPSLSPDLQS